MKPLGKRVKNWIIYVAILSAIRLLRLLPRRLALSLFEKLGMLAYALARAEQQKTRRHLKIAFGRELSDREIDELAKSCFVSLAKNAAEALRLPNLKKSGLEKYVHCDGKHYLDQAFARGQGVICITGHLGCWELMAAYIAEHYPLAVIGAQIYDSRLDEILIRERRQMGYTSFPRTVYGTRKILRWLRQGGVVGILIDQDTRVDGVFVDFFGRPAHTPVGPALLAERTAAAIVPLAIHMNPDASHTIAIRPALAMRHSNRRYADRIKTMQECTAAVEQFIRDNPSQWVWMHERWKKQPHDSTVNIQNDL